MKQALSSVALKFGTPFRKLQRPSFIAFDRSPARYRYVLIRIGSLSLSLPALV